MKRIGKRVFIYVRVSTQEQAKEGYSIQEQIDRLTKYCEAMGWTVVKVYTDAGFSGATMDRPALNQMIRALKKGESDAVVVYKLDRLSRSQLDTLYLIEKVFLANDCDFVSMNENFDTATPFGRAMIGILAVFAQLEREQIKERMMMGKEARAKEGKFAGSWAVPIGYNYIPEKDALVINEYEKMQVLQIFDLFLSGTPIRRIEKIMNESGYSHKHGNIWYDKTIRNVLKSRTYLGELKHRDEWIKAPHEAIITEEMHDKVMRLMVERKEAHQKKTRRGKVQSYLGGLLHCKHCGSKYNKVNSGDKRYDYYVCASRHKRTPRMIKDPNCKNKNWRMEVLDNLVFDEIRKLATDPEYFNQVVEEKSPDNRSEIIQSEIEKLDSQISKLMDLYTLGNMPLEIVEKRVHEINDQKEKLESELDEIAKEKENLLSTEETWKAVSSFGDVLDKGDFYEIRATIETLIDYIELDNENVDIHWKFH